ncbi:hypothetical protein ACF073_02815 [Streptomyces sp. NPDC015171]|uniref:hypothetical protein n=1 Tax=Streptomyces sp. NPDC015171 TaxID=3364945 RepID=UPI0036FBAE9E
MRNKKMSTHSYSIRAAAFLGTALLSATTAIGMFASAPAHADEAHVDDPGIASVKDATSSHVYRFDTVTPSGGKLVPAKAPQGTGITSDVLVTDENGKVVGAYDSPVAWDATNQPVSASYRIEGSTLVETVDFTTETKFPVSFARPLYSAYMDPQAADGDDVIVAASSGKVTVPSNYVYKPSMGTLHDYCTSAPEFWSDADFRGPCARHDMCYAKPGDHKKSCDAAFFKNLYQNCRYAFGSFNPLRYECFTVSATYYDVVIAAGHDH